MLLVPFISFSQKKKWVPKDTEIWTPVPELVIVSDGIPSDAIVLFGGEDLAAWEGAGGTKADWKIEGNAFSVVNGKGNIQTKQSFGSIQLHIEWKSPVERMGSSQTMGNSGVFLQSKYEVQILNADNNSTYVNGMASSVYKQHVPLVNPANKSGQWQVYDIIYTAPTFSELNNALLEPAKITVLWNGVVVQNNVTIQGATKYIGPPSYEAHGKLPIILQDHNDGFAPTVQYRNIWVRGL